MKKILIPTSIILVIITMVLPSANAQIEDDKKVHFLIKGNAENAEGEVLALVIPSWGEDNRLKSTIENGKFRFQGTLDRVESARMVFDYEIENPDGGYNFFSFFLTDDTLYVDVVVQKQFGDHIFTERRLSGSSLNEYYEATVNEFYEPYKGIVFAPFEEEYMDSLRREAFPRMRKELLEANLRLYAKPEYSLINLQFLQKMLEDEYTFNKEDISEENINLFKQAFATVDKSLRGTPEYDAVELLMNRMLTGIYQVEFVEYQLPNHKGQERSLEDIISQNEFTVLEFWGSWCKPCRRFNKESHEVYKKLKEKGIEIVGINMDRAVSRWKKASKEDNISWVDLYGGNMLKIDTEYAVHGYPTKYIFDKNKNLVELDFKTAEELFALVENE